MMCGCMSMILDAMYVFRWSGCMGWGRSGRLGVHEELVHRIALLQHALLVDVLDQGLDRGAVPGDAVGQRIAHDRRQLGELLVLARRLVRGWQLLDVALFRRRERLVQ